MSALPTLDLTGRKALVIGGAGGGIGSAVTLALIEAGAVLDVVTYDEGHTNDLIKEVAVLGGSVDVHLADVTKEKEFSKVLDQILSGYQNFRVLENTDAEWLGDERCRGLDRPADRPHSPPLAARIPAREAGQPCLRHRLCRWSGWGDHDSRNIPGPWY